MEHCTDDYRSSHPLFHVIKIWFKSPPSLGGWHEKGGDLIVYRTDLCMAKVHLPPMNKFACKLHGYIVYFILNTVFTCTVLVLWSQNYTRKKTVGYIILEFESYYWTRYFYHVEWSHTHDWARGIGVFIHIKHVHRRKCPWRQIHVDSDNSCKVWFLISFYTVSIGNEQGIMDCSQLTERILKMHPDFPSFLLDVDGWWKNVWQAWQAENEIPYLLPMP